MPIHKLVFFLSSISIRSVIELRVNEQWTQCDSCSKWRKLPVDVLIPPKWTCVENLWDQSRWAEDLI